MPDDDAPKTLYFGYSNEDGIEWSPLGESRELSLTRRNDEPPYYKRFLDNYGTLETQVVYVDRKTFKWLRKLLGYTRLSNVWAYRRDRKGHPRCR